MKKHDENIALEKKHKSIIDDSKAEESDDFPFFDEEFWTSLTPIFEEPSIAENIEETSGEGGELTTVTITRAEIMAIAKYHLMVLDDIMHDEVITGGIIPRLTQLKVHTHRRINDLVESGVITKECVDVIYDRLSGNNEWTAFEV